MLQQRVKRYLCTSDKACVLSNKKYDSYKSVTPAELFEAFTFLMENINVQFEGMLYQQIVGIPMGTHCAPLIADLFLYCYESYFMSNMKRDFYLTFTYLNNMTLLCGDVPRLPSYGVNISQFVRFARCCTSVLDFNSKNLLISSKLFTQGYRYHKLRKRLESSELFLKFGEI